MEPSERRLILNTHVESSIFLSVGLSTTSEVRLPEAHPFRLKVLERSAGVRIMVGGEGQDMLLYLVVGEMVF
jgi:hypothetical protein